MSIKAIAFDLEGNAIDVEFAHHQGHILAALEAGIMLTLDEAIRKIPHFIGGPDSLVAKEISDLIGGDQGYILERTRFYYNQLIREVRIEPRPGFLAVAKWLKENGFKIAIGSLTTTSQAISLLEKSGVGELFEKGNIVLREDVRNVKPAPDVWLETAKRMGVSPLEELVFDDSPFGIAAARTAGSIAVGMPVYNKPEVISNLLKAGAVRIFMDWREMNISALIQNLEV